MAGTYDLKRSGAQFMFNLKAGNGQVILTSERYTTKQGAEGGIGSVKVNSPLDARYRKLTSSGGSPYFTLVAANGEALGSSEMYSSTTARDAGIDSVKANGPTASTTDNT
jgi:uncharacterized protein